LAAGQLGLKSGRGWYGWGGSRNSEQASLRIKQRDELFVQLGRLILENEMTTTDQ
jgi:hypothetical protein